MAIGFPTEMGTQPSSHVKAGHTAKTSGFTPLFQKRETMLGKRYHHLYNE
jgi:hypothetical protein